MIALALACGQRAAPPAPLRPSDAPAAVALVSVAPEGAGTAATVSVTGRAGWRLTRIEAALLQSGELLAEADVPFDAPLPEVARLWLDASLERGAVQLTGTAHLTGPLGAEALVFMALSGALQEEEE